MADEKKSSKSSKGSKPKDAGMKFEVPKEIANAIHHFGTVVPFRKLKEAVEKATFEDMNPERVKQIAREMANALFDEVS